MNAEAPTIEVLANTESQAPVTDVPVSHRRAFFAACLGGAGVAACTQNNEVMADDEWEIAADDPMFPEQESPIIHGEESEGMMELAEEMAERIERGEVEAFTAGGAVAIAGKRMGRREIIAGLLAGTILLKVSSTAEAAEDPIPCIKYDINSNARPKARKTAKELIHLELNDGRS